HLPDNRLEVRHADALQTDVRTFFTKEKVKLLGNLPYYISSQLLLQFLEYPSPISLSVLMLQKEMANRLSAAPSTKDYGALTLLVQLHYRVEALRKVPANVFIPRPEVDSAIVRITPRHPTELPERDDELFATLVRRGFAQRRKQLGNLLHDHVPDWKATADSLGFDPKVRAEALSLEQWIALTNHVRPLPVHPLSQNDSESFPVVDETDRVICHAPRAKVHGDNLRHRAVHILIFNKKGEVFLQKRSRSKDRHPLLWDSSAAGHVEAGEDYNETANRELREELGIETQLEKLTKLPASDRTGQEFIEVYRGLHEGPFRLNRAEIETGRFFPPGIVGGWMKARPGDFAPGLVECWKATVATPRD
ncbi:MAG: Ribosomal small subunit methyltransferase, partial [Spartobacteria bacterium]|nr:Ribosomal small subunit methyltransferase [Spartobacteria bacterium]